jgi:putative exosortase-associated protein (TIGR04073 family)
MKNVIVIVLVIMVFCVGSCYAGEYVNQMDEKLVRGVKNIVSGVAEIGRGMENEMKQGIPVYNAFVGTIKGVGDMVVRVGSGVYDVIVAPIPKVKTFPPKPETLF